MKFIVEEMHRSIDEHSLSPSECFPVTLPCLGFTLSFQQLTCFRGSFPLASELMIEMPASAPAS